MKWIFKLLFMSFVLGAFMTLGVYDDSSPPNEDGYSYSIDNDFEMIVNVETANVQDASVEAGLILDKPSIRYIPIEPLESELLTLNLLTTRFEVDNAESSLLIKSIRRRYYYNEHKGKLSLQNLNEINNVI